LLVTATQLPRLDGAHDNCGEGQVRVPAPVLNLPDKAESVIYVDLYVTARLASFKVPEIAEFRDEPLPRNPAGKLLKNELRDKRGACRQP